MHCYPRELQVKCYQYYCVVAEPCCPEEAFLQVYDPTRDSDALKRHPEEFEHLRGNYPLRREISFLP